MVRWKTEWQTPGSGQHRIRQDGRWYAGMSRRISGKVSFWSGAGGEHFDDRAASGGEAYRTQIVRTGGGLKVNPATRFGVAAGAGLIEDRRSGIDESGLGLWSNAKIEEWNAGGYLQSLSLELNREAPNERRNEDFIADYRLYREFSPRNTNELKVHGSRLVREVYTGDLLFLAHRVDEDLILRDELNYYSSPLVQLQLAAEIIHDQTEQSTQSSLSAALEENQGVVSFRLASRYKRSTSEFSGDVRTITQTVRGDVLQGNKTEISWKGSTEFPQRSRFELELGVSKYTLDARSMENDEDRDELKFTIDTKWSKRFGKALDYELRSSVQLDHLVYLRGSYSANNRWTRLFLLGSTMQYQPVASLRQTLRAMLTATYHDYDFDLNDRSQRSTVHRRLSLGDSARYSLSRNWTAVLAAGISVEEFGRLFWDSFEEQRTDAGHSHSAMAIMERRIWRRWLTGAGGLWDSRENARFSDDGTDAREVYLQIRNYGPLAVIRYLGKSRFNVSIRGQAVRQFQLDRDSRWIVSGEASAGWTW